MFYVLVFQRGGGDDLMLVPLSIHSYPWSRQILLILSSNEIKLHEIKLHVAAG